MRNNQHQYIQYGALEQYMRLVDWTPRLGEGEEEQLLSSLVCGGNGEDARVRLAEGYQPLIIGLAKRYVRNCKFMELMDLVQEGNLGLLQAIDCYRGDRRASFKTWVFTYVRAAMAAALCQYERAFHMPLEKVKAIRRVGYVHERLLALLGRDPTIGEIAQEMRLGDDEVRELIILGQEVYSLYLLVDEDGETLLGDVIEDPASEFVDGVISSVDDILAPLTGEERAVIKLRYGFEDGLEYTQREVAELLGIALSSVAAADRSAKRRLRKALEAGVA